MKEINDTNISLLKAGDKVVKIEEDYAIYYEYLMVHPHNNDYILMLDHCENIKKFYIPNILNQNYYIEYTYKEIYQKEIEYLESQIKHLEGLILIKNE